MKEDLIKTYDKVSKDFGYNSNSLHKLGMDARKIEEAASKQILEVLNLENYDVIYTSGNAESFELINKNIKNKKHIDIKPDKIYDNLSSYDFITIEDDLPFFGVLLKKDNINIEPLIHGGKSTTIYRSGTSPTPMIVTMSKLIKLKYKQ